MLTNEDIFDLLAVHARDAHRVRSSKHAAMILSHGRPLSIGLNRLKTHPMMYKFSKNHNKVYLHAEIDAIVRAINRYGADVLDGSQLYVLRLDRKNNVASSKPCETCQRALKAFNIKGHWT